MVAHYAYNAGNQRTTFTNAASTYVSYTYDPIGQLKVADSSVAGEDRGYTYDAAWNLNYRTNSGGLATFKVDVKNQLTNLSLIPLTSDGNGNLIFDKLSKHSSLGYAYDDENRLQNWYGYADEGGGSGTPDSSSDLRTEFVYDGQGRLRVRVEYTTDGADWIVSTETRYVYDGLRVIQERNGSNVPTVSYTRGTDLSGSLEGAGGIGGLLGRSHGHSAGNWTNHNFYFADGNGNVTYLVNSSQTMAASYRYDPFGNTISLSGGLADANVYRFSSKEIHDNSGFYYYGYRWYAPSLQRWPNRDPIGERGGINLYNYVRNNPVNETDPLGLDRNHNAPPSSDYIFPQPPANNFPSVIDASIVGFFGGGASTIYCCNEKKRRIKATFVKWCVGLYIGASATVGFQQGVSGSGCPMKYSGGFIEAGGGNGPLAGGGAVSLDGSVGAATVGIGLRGGVMWCKYTLASVEDVGCCK